MSVAFGDSSLRRPLLASDEDETKDNALTIPPCDEDGTSNSLSAGRNSPAASDEGSETNATPQSPNDTDDALLHIGHRNISLTLWYATIAFAGRSIWNQSVLAAFVYLLQNEDPKAVGFLTGAMGIAQLLASFPTGYLADKYPRDTLLKGASLVGLLAISATITVCWLDTHYLFLVMALSLWGFYYGVANTSIMALFADSIPDGQRCLYFTQRSICVMTGNMMGPICALGMFHLLGDNWTVRDCAVVMTLGQTICAPAVILLCFFRDGRQLDTLRSTRDANSEMEDAILAADTERPEPMQDDDCAIEASGNGSQTDTEATVSETTQQSLPFQSIFRNHPRTIPILIAFSDVISGLGAGMSIRYFPLFFMDKLGFSPVQVQIIYFCCTLSQVVLAKTSQKLADGYLGRCRTTVTFKWTGIVFMAAMIMTHLSGSAPSWVVGLLFVLRTGFMNSCGALTRSLLMDNVPSSERGKWSALESVNMFSWSGSAALGGFLVQWLGMLPLFGLTSAIQLLSSLVVLSLAHVDTMPLSSRRSAEPSTD